MTNVPASEVMNSSGYWDNRFSSDWADRGGPQQTTFFADLAISMLPNWLKEDIRERGLSIVDFGCAEGDATPVLSRIFPASEISGVDVSQVAIERASARFPDTSFHVLNALNPIVACDVLYCSNTLEHFAEWQNKLHEISAFASRHVVVMAPFRELEPMTDEHMARFDFNVLPVVLNNGFTLQHVSVRDTSRMPETKWNGLQFLAIWSNGIQMPAEPRASIESIDDIDFRGVPSEAIGHCLGVAKRAYTSLSLERQHVLRLSGETTQMRQALEYQRVVADNQLIETRVGLENQLIETRVYLENKNIESEAARKAACAELEAARGSLEEHATRLAKVSDEFNTELASRERALQGKVDTLRQNYSRITSMRSFQVLMRGLRAYARWRGHDISTPSALERVNVGFSRFNPASMVASRHSVAQARQAAKLATMSGKRSPRLPAQPTTRRTDKVILIQVASLGHDNVGQLARELALAWSRTGGHVVLFAVCVGGAVADELSDAGIRVETFDSRDAYYGAVQALEIERAFLIQNLFGIETFLSRGVAAFPVLCVKDAALPGWDGSETVDLSAVTRFIAVTDAVARSQSQLWALPLSKIDVIPMPFDDRAFVRPEKRLLDYSRKNRHAKFGFISVGPFDDKRSHASLVTAFAGLYRGNTQARLKLIGSITDTQAYADLREQIEVSGLASVVSVSDLMNDRELGRHLASAHVFIGSYQPDADNIATLQAGYFGLPIILRVPCDALDWVVDGKNGIILPSGMVDNSSIGVSHCDDAGASVETWKTLALTAAMQQMILDYEPWRLGAFEAQSRVSRHAIGVVMRQYATTSSGQMAKVG